MNKVFRVRVLITMVFVLLAFSLLGCAYWLRTQWLPQPVLDHISYDQLLSNWKSQEKPLFPPRTNWGGDDEFYIRLSSRLKWKAVYTGYSGGGQLGKLAQDAPFLVFFIDCKRTDDENNNAGLPHLYEERHKIGNDDIEAILAFDLLKEETRNSIEAKAGQGNYINMSASFFFQKYSYLIHGIFPLAGTEFSASDSSVMKVSEIVIKYINDMVLSANKLSQQQADPQVSGFDKRFVESYVNEKVTTQSGNATIPCFTEDVLLYNSGSWTLGIDAGSKAALSFRTDLFEQIVKVYPDPLVRKIGDYVYLVYDTDKQTRLFLFFSIAKTNALFADGFPVIMKRKLGYYDFSGLQTGNSLSDVEKVDPIMSLYRRRFDSLSSEAIKTAQAQGKSLTSIHLLSDGILKIAYMKSGDAYLITNIQYQADFVLDGMYGKTSYKILDADYIN